MSEVIGSVWWLLVSLGVLVTFHEFGHYWVARRCGVKVLRFSVGFGRPLWMHRGKDGTEYVIAAIPLGGYVKMLGEHDGDVPAAEVAQSRVRWPSRARAPPFHRVLIPALRRDRTTWLRSRPPTPRGGSRQC